jgi:hypothetical protein
LHHVALRILHGSSSIGVADAVDASGRQKRGV